ncbi:MAG: hypothetical protein MJB57_07075, partial [Gemmatimonadetes bacterium]|nr:hypothetical protein [Gemmatimonadota bacterium]
FLRNDDGAALALLIGVVLVAAFVRGAVFDGRAGFCNAICPVLPVERLYGQRPLLDVGRARCASCSACGRSCIDLAPSRSVKKLVSMKASPGAGTSPDVAAWVRTPLGAFAASFPGFVVGYFSAPDGPLETAVTVYAWILGLSLASYTMVWLVARLAKPSPRVGLAALGALGAGLYYWFAAPGLATALGAPGAAGPAFRTAALSFVFVWAVRASSERTNRVP